MTNTEMAEEFAREYDYEAVEHLGPWRGWDCFSLIRRVGQISYEGAPYMVMVRGSEVRMSTYEESIQSLRAFYPEEYEDEEDTAER